MLKACKSLWPWAPLPEAALRQTVGAQEQEGTNAMFVGDRSAS
jgi:hypothetical protein